MTPSQMEYVLGVLARLRSAGLDDEGVTRTVSPPPLVDGWDKRVELTKLQDVEFLDEAAELTEELLEFEEQESGTRIAGSFCPVVRSIGSPRFCVGIDPENLGQICFSDPDFGTAIIADSVETFLQMVEVVQ